MEQDFEVYDAKNGDLVDIFSIIIDYDELTDQYIPNEQDWAVVLAEWGDLEVVIQVQDHSKNVKGFSSTGTLKFPLNNRGENENQS